MTTSTCGRSPGVRMSWSAKWSWKPETPGSEPAGARISAGKSGKVERSLPSIAVSLVNCPPVSCIPSPESPAKRMTTESRCSTAFAIDLGLARSLAERHQVDTTAVDAIEAENLVKTYPGNVRALDGLTFSVEEG